MNLINRDDIHITVHYARECGKREVTDALVKAIEEAIFKLPVIDAEPVTRCKDCIKKELCSIFRDAKQELGFCAWAERKEE